MNLPNFGEKESYSYGELADFAKMVINFTLASMDAPEFRGRTFFPVIIDYEMAFVCDKFGVIDGPYTRPDARYVSHKENGDTD